MLSYFEEIALLADVLRAGSTHLDDDAFGFVDVSAEEIFGLLRLDEIVDSAAAGVESFMYAIERGVERRGVGDQHQRLQRSEFSRRSASSASLYSPGVLNGVGFE